MSLNFKRTDFSFRPVVIEDAAMMLDWRNQDSVREGMFHSRRMTMEEQVPWLQRCIDAPEKHYYIFQYRGRDTGVFGVYDVNSEQRVGEWVYFMGPRYPELPKGAGAAMEFIALDAFFGEVGLRRLWGRTLRANERVWKIHQRFGFQIEGVLREHVSKDGVLIDMLCVGLLAREWRQQRLGHYRALFAPGGEHIGNPFPPTGGGS